MNYLLFPIFNRLVKPSKILGLCSINESGEFNFHNFHFGNDTPFYKYEQEQVDDVLKQYADGSVISVFKKGFYGFNQYKEYWNEWKDLNSLLWMKGKDIEDGYYDPKNYVFLPLSYYSRYMKDLYNSRIFNRLFDVDQPKEIDSVLEASFNLDGKITVGKEKLYKYFDHYTKGGRFRDVISNSISMERSKRADIKSKGVKVYVDIDSYHIRLIDEKLGGMIPKNQRGHDWLIEQAYGDDKPPEEKQKKIVFTALYSENFDMLECEFTYMLQRKLHKFKSPTGRRNIPFNHIIQEMDVIRMSGFINKLYSNKSNILLYLYDGLLFDVNKSYLKEFLNECKEVIDMPFTVNIKDEMLKFNYS